MRKVYDLKHSKTFDNKSPQFHSLTFVCFVRFVKLLFWIIFFSHTNYVYEYRGPETDIETGFSGLYK